ncbi:methyl-accepting chemotaxis protein [Lachnospiraceae bacterium]|nr:methyl-accepting chemotaxis protein [Lachnospiraceae bacterium]
MSKEKNQPKKRGSISTVLLTILLPITALGIAVIIFFLVGQAQTQILDLTKENLISETSENANKIGVNFKMLTAKFGQYADTLENVHFEDHDAILEYIKPSVSYQPIENSGIYLGFPDDSYLFANGTVQADTWKPTERDWYKEGIKHETFVNYSPYKDSSTNEWCITYSRKVDFNNAEPGVMGMDITLTTILNTTAEIKPMEAGDSFIVDDAGYLIAYNDEAKIGTSFKESDPTLYALFTAGIDGVGENRGSDGKLYYVATAPIPGTTWTLISSVPEKHIFAKINKFRAIALSMMVFIIAVLVVAILITVNRVIKTPLHGLSEQITTLATGDFTVQLPKGKNNEIGLIQDELKIFIEKMRKAMSRIQNSASQLQTEAADSREIAAAMTGETQEQSHSVSQIRDALSGISNAVTEIANDATSLAGAVADLTEQSNDAGSIAGQLITSADAGKTDMKAVARSMDDISNSMDDMNTSVITVGESAAKINDIIEMISSIADQTNLLSLNASIEAARAGEAGRGFAVVASEIAALATSSAESSQKIAAIITDITRQIQDLSDKSKANVDTIEKSNKAVMTAEETFAKLVTGLENVGEAMKGIDDKMISVDEIASNLAAISEEQSASTQEILATVEHLSDSADQIAQSSHDVDNGANTVSSSATDIANDLSVFKID